MTKGMVKITMTILQCTTKNFSVFIRTALVGSTRNHSTS